MLKLFTWWTGQSLEETKGLVRKKLGLEYDASIRFARIHEGKTIELEDGAPFQPHLYLQRSFLNADDDFTAFRHLARFSTSIDVSVFVGQEGPRLSPKKPPSTPVCLI